MTCPASPKVASNRRLHITTPSPTKTQHPNPMPRTRKHLHIHVCLGQLVHHGALAHVGVATKQHRARVGVDGRKAAHVLPYLRAAQADQVRSWAEKLGDHTAMVPDQCHCTQLDHAGSQRSWQARCWKLAQRWVVCEAPQVKQSSPARGTVGWALGAS
jgi:hypothetical protein